MSDNSRFPGHPSDMNSSRSTGGSGISSQHTTPPPVSYQPSPSSAPNHQTRNVILGAVATIITSTVIYYLTVYMNRPNAGDGKNYPVIKEATVEAWKSYKAYENTYVNNVISFQKTFKENNSIEGLSDGVNGESKKFTKDLTTLSKTENIDPDLVIAFNRRIENEKNALLKINEYYANVKRIIGSGANIKKIKEDYVAEELRWSLYSRGTFERSINDINEIAKILSERYVQPFSLNDFLIVQIYPQLQKTYDSVINVLKNTNIDSNGNVIQTNFATHLSKKDLEGNWNVEGDVVSLKKDGSLTWTLVNGKKATGTWKIVDNKLKIEATFLETIEKVNYTYRVSNLTATSYTVSQSEPPFLQYDATRIVAN